MARSPEYEPLYEAFGRFLELCALGNRSLLWPNEEAWTPENVAEVKQRLVDAPMVGGELSFVEKLREQMKGASRQHWIILCDVFYVYFLPSSYMKLKKKRNDIQWAAQQGGLAPLPEDAEIWEAQNVGFTRTSLKYHYKYAQFWLILLFVDHVKGLTDTETVMRNPKEMQSTLDKCLEIIDSKNDRAYDMRHAMLYMAFPDYYERIISTRDKEWIVATYRDRIDGPAPGDLDETIRRIREALSEEHDKPGRPFDFYRDLKHEWRPGTAPPVDDGELPSPVATESEDVSIILAVLGRTRNLILYGPPGTGKTYIADKVAKALVEDQTEEPLPESALNQRAIEGLTAYEVIALSMFTSGGQQIYSVPAIVEQPLVQARHRVSSVKSPIHSVWARLQEHTSPESETVKVSSRREPYLFDKDDEGHWHLTEGGRAFVEQTLSKQLSALRSSTAAKSAGEFTTWTTFHQSYAYEDFVEGLRPIPSEESPGEISYDIVPGAFRRICARAAEDPSNKYVMVIDEINRGNIAKILGELITLLEDDKRDGEDTPLSVTLPYSGHIFTVPGNLYIIGTMNTADRSIALVDVALRRRFAFAELMPRPELLDSVKVESQETVVPLGDLLRGLNQGIRRYLDRDHQIGHSYFLKVAQAGEAERVDVLEFVWNNQVMPLLEEYFYSQWDKLAELLAPFRTDVEPGIEAVEDEGIDFELGRQTGDDLMVALAKLAERGTQ
jgi:biotin operon repressor/DNA polymerase III delta prime subunit